MDNRTEIESNMTTTSAESTRELRQRAEEKYRMNEGTTSKPRSPEETECLLHELRVHQIELEMLNEELRRVQEELESSKSSFFDLYDLAPVGYLTVSDEGLILKTNLAAATMLGVPRNYPFHMRISQFIFPEDQGLYYQCRKQLIDSGDLQNWEMRIKRVDGSCFWAELQSTLAHNGENWIILKEITERKQAEEVQREGEERLRAIMDNTDSVIYMKDVESKYIMINRRFEKLFKVNRKEVLGKTDYDIFPTEIAAVFQESDHTVFNLGKPLSLEEIAPLDDGIHTYASIKFPVFGVDGRPIAVCGISNDITERKQLEQQFQQAQKMESLGVLSGGIAHDFNNILAIIIGYCALTKMDYKTAEKNIPEIENAAERAAALCRQMLAYAGKAQLTKTQVNLCLLVDEMVTMLKSTLPQNAVIKPDLSTDIPVIDADASQLRQIVMNLIINASEAIGKEQGEIKVSLANTTVIAGQSDTDYNGKAISPGVYILLEVTDNGCGMDAETKWRIFEPFYTTKFTGRGLGMSAVLGIINSHGGALQLFSQLGHGSTFKVYLPVKDGNSTEMESIQQVTSNQWRGSGTILLVEDEEQVRHIARELLEMFGFTVLEAVNGKDALELYQQNAADITLVVTDMGMPIMDGYELFHELKKLNPELPIIASSGYGDAEVSSRIGSDNIAGLISKPYNPIQLREVLKAVFEDK